MSWRVCTTLKPFKNDFYETLTMKKKMNDNMRKKPIATNTSLRSPPFFQSSIKWAHFEYQSSWRSINIYWIYSNFQHSNIHIPCIPSARPFVPEEIFSFFSLLREHSITWLCQMTYTHAKRFTSFWQIYSGWTYQEARINCVKNALLCYMVHVKKNSAIGIAHSTECELLIVCQLDAK